MVRKFERNLSSRRRSIRVALILVAVGFVVIARGSVTLLGQSLLQAHGLSFDSFISSKSLYRAWETSNETCLRWFAQQRAHGGYLDAYIVGSQKAGTTQVTHMLELLGVRHKDMIKEWHFYNHLTATGHLKFGRFEPDPLPSLEDLTRLRLMHLQTGFPSFNISELPVLDDGPIHNRTIVIDSTVEYLHMERAAILSSLLTPHAKIIIMIRDPPSRALSQYNMYNRDNNRKLRHEGLPDRLSSPDVFHKKVNDEIRVLRSCGYDDQTAVLTGNTTSLIRCMRNARPKIDDVMYVLRGLYFLHVAAWRKYFPDHHLLLVPFSDIARGYGAAYQRIADFLCVKRFPQELLKALQSRKSGLSFGQQAAREGLLRIGADSYSGNDRYLSEMWPSTRAVMDDFYGAANSRLEEMVGKAMF